MAKDAIYEGTREVRTFVDLAHGADVLITKTEQEPKGSYYTTMSALLLTAFTFEAYLNHLGEKTIKFWEEIEPVKVMDKYSVLCKNLGLRPDFSKRPYQTLKALFTFRNAIAHGKSQILQEKRRQSVHRTIRTTILRRRTGRSTPSWRTRRKRKTTYRRSSPNCTKARALVSTPSSTAWGWARSR